MATIVKVRKWGNSLGVRIPKSFAAQHAIADGAVLEIDGVRMIDSPVRRRSRYKLTHLLKGYAKPPKELDFSPVGRELS